MKLKITAALFEVTNNCNLNCIHCYKENLGGEELPLKQIKIIIEKISAKGVNSILITGGEPFLRKDLFEIIDYAKECGIEDVVINTNGIPLDNPRIVSEIKKHLDIISAIPVSFDGARSETHDFIRGKGQFSKLMRILENNSLDDLPIGVNVTIGKWNFMDFKEFFTVYDELNACDINFGIFIPLGADTQLADQVLTPAQCRSLIEMSKKKREAGYEVELCSLPYSNIYTKDISGSCCNIFTEFLTITAQGNVVPCILYDFSCGSLLEMELDEILSNPVVKFFRNPKKMQGKMKGHCKICPKFNLCKGGCNLLTYALLGDIYESDPLCPFTLQKKK